MKNRFFLMAGIFLMVLGIALILVIETGIFGLTSISVGGLLFIISMKTKGIEN